MAVLYRTFEDSAAGAAGVLMMYFMKRITVPELAVRVKSSSSSSSNTDTIPKKTPKRTVEMGPVTNNSVAALPPKNPLIKATRLPCVDGAMATASPLALAAILLRGLWSMGVGGGGGSGGDCNGGDGDGNDDGGDDGDDAVVTGSGGKRGRESNRTAR